MSEILSFSIDYMKILEEDDLITLIQLKPIITGSNRHKTYFSLDAIKNAEKTLFNKPVNCIWNNFTNDFTDHARNERQEELRDCIGCVPETNDPKIVEEDGKYVQYVNAAIWKYYFPKMALKLKNNNTTKLSMEISVEKSHKRDDGDVEIDEYKYVGFTLLGQNMLEAVPNANAKIIKYSTVDYDNMVSNTNKQLMTFAIPEIIKINAQQALDVKQKNPQLINIAKDIIKNDKFTFSKINWLNNKINNIKKQENLLFYGGEESKEWIESIINNDNKKDNNIKTYSIEKDKLGKSSAINIKNDKDNSASGKWEDPGADLLNKLLEASNYKDLLNESYLIIDKVRGKDQHYEDTSIDRVHYPHHVLKDNNLVVHFKGVQAALSRARAEGLTGEPITHLKRHYEELGLNMDNFSEYGLSDDDYKFLFSKEEGDKMKIDFSKAVEKFGLNSSQMLEIFDIALSQYKYKIVDREYKKFYPMSFDEDFVFVWDCEDDSNKRVNYTLSDNVALIDIESAETVISAGYMPVDDSNNNGNDDDDTIDYKAKFEEMSATYEAMCTKYSDLEKDSTEKFSELETLKQFKADIEKKDLENKAEELYSKYSDYISEDEKKDLNVKLFSVEDFDVFKEKVFAIVTPKIEAENLSLKSKNNNPVGNTLEFSTMPLIDPNKINDNKTSLEKLKEYVNS